MPTTTSMEPLLSSRRIVLWVEDMTTKEYLLKIWQPEDSLFQILIAGSNESVKAVVHDNIKSGYDHVFGLIDRDFGDSNRHRWGEPNNGLSVFKPERFKPERHEIENYLLDWDALAGCTENSRNNRTRNEIETRANGFAAELLCWMACRQTIVTLRERLLGNFPLHPRLNKIDSLDKAKDYIMKSRHWWRALPGTNQYIANERNISLELKWTHGNHKDDLEDGNWVKSFSGKEIYCHIKGFMVNARYAPVETMDTDLAKSVAEWQFANGAIPQELLDLKDCLKTRVGIP